MSILFDNRHASGVLKDRFANLFQASYDQHSTVSQVNMKWRDFGSASNHWWNVNIPLEEEIDLSQFFLLVSSISFKPRKDMLSWGSSSHKFRTKYCYALLQTQVISNSSFKQEILPTLSFLSHRIHNADIPSQCHWCKSSKENIQHLFFQCEVARWAWDYTSCWWRQRPLCDSILDFWYSFFHEYKG